MKIMTRQPKKRRYAILLTALPAAICIWTTATTAAEISGKVMEAGSGTPLPNANIQLLDTDRGTYSREDGSYLLKELEPGALRLRITHVGYAPQERDVVLGKGDRLQISFTLELQPLELPGMVVTGLRVDPNGREVLLDKSYSTQVFASHGFSLIRKGTIFASDLYADGLKRGDISVTIDGERFSNACPNRMDPPTTRVNPLEMTDVELSKSCSSCGCGLGGRVSFHRETPCQAWQVRGGLSGTALDSEEYDAALAVDRAGHRATGRFVRGGTYRDPQGREFTDLYGYKQNYTFSLGEFSLYGERDDWEHGIGFSVTDNVVFPYLLMDERENDLWNAYAAYRGHKLYVNHTYHVMDNQLRVSPMLMETVARQLMAGLTGEGYEFYYRNWDADNKFVGAATIQNHMMPDLHLLSAALSHTWHLGSGWRLTGLAGLQRQWLGDGERLTFHRQYHPASDDAVIFVPFGLTLSHIIPLNQTTTIDLLLEGGSQAPEPEQLYIAVRKPPTKPSWSGNPQLDAPLRVTARTGLRTRLLELEFFGTRMWNYVALARRTHGGAAFQTFENIDAWLGGVNLNGSWRMLELAASWHWGENSTRRSPLAEIQPLQASVRLWAPPFRDLQPYAHYTVADAQNHVDPHLNESATSSWQRLDLGFEFGWERMLFYCELQNVANEEYTQHLSYLRNPFAAGTRVVEPGRTLRMGVGYNY